MVGWVRPLAVTHRIKGFASRGFILNVGARTHGRGTFLCLSKEKCPKERTPDCRLSPPRLAFAGGCQKGYPYPSGNARIPFRAPLGYSRRKLRCSARQTGQTNRTNFSSPGMDTDKNPVYQWLLEFSQKHWYEWSGLFSASIIAFISTLLVITDTDLNLITKGASIASVEVLLAFFWLISKRIPKSRKDKVGFAVCIYCGSREEAERVQDDLVIPLHQLIKSGQSGKSFDFIEIHQHIAKAVIDIDDALNLQRKCRAHFLIYGRVKVRNVNGKPAHIIDVEGLVSHKPLPQAISNQLASEFTELFLRNGIIPVEHDIFSFHFASQWAATVAKYIIGIASALSGDMDYAEKLFQDVYQTVVSHLAATSNRSAVPVYKKLQERVPLRISELYEVRAYLAHKEWVKTHDERYVDEMIAMLEHVHELKRKTSPFLIQRAICAFLKYRDVRTAKDCLREIKDQDNSIWHYNIALLEAYEGRLKNSIRHYRMAIEATRSTQQDLEADILFQVEDFIFWLLEHEPHKYQLHFCLGFFYWKSKGDHILALHHFKKFIELRRENQFAKEFDLAEKWILEVKKSSFGVASG